MTDFIEKVFSRELNPPYRSGLDVDFYKFTMGQWIFKTFPDVQVTFELIIRDPHISLAEWISPQELRDCLDAARTVRLTPTDMAYLRGMRVYQVNMFSEAYTAHLEQFQLPEYQLELVGGQQYQLRFTGSWLQVSMWETIALAIISELYYRKQMQRMPRHEIDILYARGKDRVYSKLEKLHRYPYITFADFSQRRRHSFLWQKWVVGLCKEVMKNQFVGTSNTWMAFHHNLTPIGTNAHEMPMVVTALAASESDTDAIRNAQFRVLHGWEQLYQQGLRIFLPDTYGTEQFLAGAPEWLADWRGMRQDSGDPISRGELYISWLQKWGRDPKEKLIIFSDGLDVDDMIRIADHFRDRIKTSFGWGTLLGNDFRGCHSGDDNFRPFSVVCKVVSVNGRPAVKLPDNLNKKTGASSEVERYIRIFGREGRTESEVYV